MEKRGRNVSLTRVKYSFNVSYVSVFENKTHRNMTANARELKEKLQHQIV
jgi:hypothetical protein